MSDENLERVLNACMNSESGIAVGNIDDDGVLYISTDPLNPEGNMLGLESIDIDLVSEVMERPIEIAFCKNPKTGITKKLVFAPDALVYKLIVCNVEEMELRHPIDAVDEYNDRAI